MTVVFFDFLNARPSGPSRTKRVAVNRCAAWSGPSTSSGDLRPWNGEVGTELRETLNLLVDLHYAGLMRLRIISKSAVVGRVGGSPLPRDSESLEDRLIEPPLAPEDLRLLFPTVERRSTSPGRATLNSVSGTPGEPRGTLARIRRRRRTRVPALVGWLASHAS